MSKRKRVAFERAVLGQVIHEQEWPDDLIKQVESVGFHYMEVTVTDKTAGGASKTVYLPCGPGDAQILYEAILEAVKKASATFYENATVENVTYAGFEGEGAGHTVDAILKKKILGGRPDGMSENTAASYRALAEWYYKAVNSNGGDLTQREFCHLAEVSQSRLARALRYVSNNPP